MHEQNDLNHVHLYVIKQGHFNTKSPIRNCFKVSRFKVDNSVLTYQQKHMKGSLKLHHLILNEKEHMHGSTKVQIRNQIALSSKN